MTRYLTLRAPHLHVKRRQQDGQSIYAISCGIDLGPLQGFIMDAMLFGCASMGAQLTGSPVAGSSIQRRGPEPAYFHRFRQQIPIPVVYGAGEDAIVIPDPQLALPIRFSDDQLAASSKAQCEEALRLLTEDAGFACRVRRVIETSHPFPPKLARVATTLFVSERTLKRRLQAEEASFQHLVDQVRLERAGELLQQTAMNLSQIADAWATPTPPTLPGHSSAGPDRAPASTETRSHCQQQRRSREHQPVRWPETLSRCL